MVAEKNGMDRQGNGKTIGDMKKLVLYFTFIVFIASCNHTSTEKKRALQKENGFVLDMENIYRGKLLAKTAAGDTLLFTGAKFISKDKVFSGKNSILLTPGREFALGTFISVRANDCYTFTIKAYGKTGKLFFVASAKNSDFYSKGSVLVDSSDTGWKTLFFRLKIPEAFKDSTIKFYVWNHGKDTVFLDDLSMEGCKELSEVFDKNEHLLKIYLDKKARKKIEKIKEEAEKNGVITTNKKSWFKTLMFYGNEVYDVKMRIKGDWLDHISGKKKSFRIKIRNNKAFKRMKVFSIQKPSTRYFIHQWFVYSWFRAEDILAPRYDFVPVQINNEILGYYAVEEYFEKQLLESLKRREGPILKFSEDALWDKVIMYLKTNEDYRYPFYEASKILPFDRSKVLKNKVLFNEFKIAKNLLYQYKYSLAPLSEIFDVDKAAKFFAMIDVANAWHGLQWHNLRFYYNPILCKLEFVNYDDFVDNGIYTNFTDQAIWGTFDRYDFSKSFPADVIARSPFADTNFVKSYIKYLEQFSGKNYWDSVFSVFDSSIGVYYAKLKYEYPEAYFNKKLYYNQAQRVYKALPQYKQMVKEGFYDKLKFPETTYGFYTDRADTFFLKDYVKAFVQKRYSDSVVIRVENYFPDTVLIEAYSKKKKSLPLSEEIKVLPFSSGKGTSEFTLPEKKVKKLVVRYGDFSTEVEVLPWEAPSAWSPRQELEQKNPFPHSSFYSVLNDTVYFSGTHTIEEIVLIPKGYVVIFEPGTHIDFINGGGFISYSPVLINGTKSHPVTISSSDRKSNGFTVLQAGQVRFKHAVFDGLGTLSYKGWQLSGAVTIYETETFIDSSMFKNNVCEDDLNIVRSNFVVTNSSFVNTFSDAFDSDFCTGITSNCTFRNLGNDAIDFSTSEIKITNCKIYNASDKGISGGEASKLFVSNCLIDGANIGIASKDLSVLRVDNTVIKDATYGFAVFMKKPEYGPAKIFAEKIKSDNVIFDEIVEKESLFRLDGKIIRGGSKNVASKFY